MKNIKYDLYEELKEIPVIDAHEHFPGEAEYLKNQYSGMNLFAGGFIWHDLESAGLESEFKNTMRNSGYKAVKDWWPKIEPYWRNVCHGSYARALRIAVKDLYGIPEINNKTINYLVERLVDDNRPGLYRRVFQEKCNIKTSITQAGQAGFPDDPAIVGITSLFKPGSHSNNCVEAIAKRIGREIDDLDDLVDICQTLLCEDLENGAVGFKYVSVAMERPDKVLAEKEFSQAKKKESPNNMDKNTYSNTYPALRDYLVDKCFDVAANSKVPVAIHAGMSTLKGYWRDYRNLDPKHLLPVAERRGDVHFDLFHLGVPMLRDAAFVGKLLPNVSLNLTWCPVVSEVQASFMLNELIDLVPVNKIIAFGGDYKVAVQKVYGHLEIVRQILTKVLANRINKGYLDKSEALRLGKLWLHDNPMRIYNLD
jgi:uncharacterized protein